MLLWPFDNIIISNEDKQEQRDQQDGALNPCEDLENTSSTRKSICLTEECTFRAKDEANTAAIGEDEINEKIAVEAACV